MEVLFHPQVLTHRLRTNHCSVGGREAPDEVPGSLHYTDLERGSQDRILEFWDTSEIRQSNLLLQMWGDVHEGDRPGGIYNN